MTAKLPAYVYLYEVTYSDLPKTPVGSWLIDKGRVLKRTWEFYNFRTGDESYIVGKRLDRLCSTCYAERRLARAYGHEHPHFEGADIRPGIEVSV